MNLTIIEKAAEDVVNGGMRVPDACEKHGLSRNLLYMYLRLKFPPEVWKYKNRRQSKNFGELTKVWEDCRVRHDEQNQSLAEIAKIYGVSRQRIHQLVNKGRALRAEQEF
jgi:predicted DNA-binding transcriptional regulator AlpA